VLERHQRLKRLVRGAGIAAVALLLLAAVAGSEVGAIVGGVAVLAWFALAVFRQVQGVGGRLDKSGDWLQLRACTRGSPMPWTATTSRPA